MSSGAISSHASAIAAACRSIETSEELPDLSELAAAAGMSPFHFHRVFKKVIGVTPKAYSVAQRGQRVRNALSKSGSVTAAIYDAGFNSNSRFYEKSNDLLGMAPTTFRGGGKGEIIRFAAGECSLGSIVTASSEKGVCCILLGDDPDELVRELQRRFPKAELVGGDAAYENVVAQVIGLVEEPAQAFHLPLDIRGTVFQQRVWQALREIPVGSTNSYTQIAEKIGSSRAVRAVAGACAANHLAVVIPCHRVVKSDGGLSGYRWGVERKRALLLKEKLSVDSEEEETRAQKPDTRKMLGTLPLITWHFF